MKILNFKKLFTSFLIIFLIIGSLSSLKVGISHDEWHEEENWKFNLKIIKTFKDSINSENESTIDTDSYLDRYYGIGFQYISQPIQYFLKDKIKKYENVDDFGAKLISKHLVVFLFFFISGILFYQIIKNTIKDKVFSYFSTFLYLLYPYLLGHSFFSPKDIPFMSVWLLCTYLNFNVFNKLLKNKELSYFKVLILAVSTGFLLSIRVTGILIFFQYIITLLIFLNLTNLTFANFIKKFYKKIIFFTLFLIISVLILSPVYWTNPFSFFHAIKWMSHYYHDVCTNTLGVCMRAKELPSTYMFIWLSVKIPLIILVGFLLIPFTEKKIFKDDKKTLVFGTLLGTAILLPLLMVILNVNLYDEIRHIMFLIPLFFILGITSLYHFSKKFFLIFGFFTLSIFIYENIKIYPYQYVWFNLPARYLDLTKKFELEYMGISGREISKKILKMNEEKMCILSSPGHTVEPYFFNSKFNCFDKWQLIDTDYQRPFLAVQHVRNIKKGMTYNCEAISETNFKLLFHKKRFVTGKLLKCN